MPHHAGPFFLLSLSVSGRLAVRAGRLVDIGVEGGGDGADDEAAERLHGSCCTASAFQFRMRIAAFSAVAKATQAR